MNGEQLVVAVTMVGLYTLVAGVVLAWWGLFPW